MWLILCATEDSAALWAYEGLRKRGLTPLELVGAEALAYALRWHHHLDSTGASIEITLANGLEIDSRSLRGVLNRIGVLPVDHLIVAQKDDRDYAIQELNAFHISWLYSITAPVLNRPTPQGLAGQWRHPSEWVHLAAKAGLPTSTYRLSGRDQSDGMAYREGAFSRSQYNRTVFAVDDEIVGDSLPLHLLEGCRRFARLTGCELIGIEFVFDPSNGWIFANATPVPDLRLGGEPLLNALASGLGVNLEKI